MTQRSIPSGGAGSSTRRGFLRQAGAAAAAAAIAPRVAITSAPAVNGRIGVGVIGAGGRAGAHLGCIQWLKTEGKEPVDVVAVADVYRPRLQRAAERFRAKAYMDYRKLLEDPNVDVVCIATPDHHHAPQTIAAFKAGKDVFCEKPFTHWRQFDLLRQAARTAKETGRVFQLGTQGMSDTAWHQARQLVKDGLIGPPIHAECGYFRVGDWGEAGMPIDDPKARPGADLDWEGFLGDSPKRDFDVSRFFRWRMYEDYAGGPVTDLYPHSLTPVVAMLGVGFPSIVVATGGKFRYDNREVPDTFNMLIDYPEKLTVAVLGTQGNNHAGGGSRGSGHRGPIIRGWEGTLTFEPKDIVFTPAEGSKKKAQRFAIRRGEDLIEHWRNLLTCVRQRKTDTFSPMDLAYRVQTALIMGYLAFRKPAVAGFDPAKEEITVKMTI